MEFLSYFTPSEADSDYDIPGEREKMEYKIKTTGDKLKISGGFSNLSGVKGISKF